MLFTLVNIAREYHKQSEWDRISNSDTFTYVNYVRKRIGPPVLSYTVFCEDKGRYIQEAHDAVDKHGLNL